MIIYVSGVFDLFHYGHMILLKKCKKLYKNCYLVVGVHSDEDCIPYKRKPLPQPTSRTLEDLFKR